MLNARAARAQPVRRSPPRISRWKQWIMRHARRASREYPDRSAPGRVGRERRAAAWATSAPAVPRGSDRQHQLHHVVRELLGQRLRIHTSRLVPRVHEADHPADRMRRHARIAKCKHAGGAAFFEHPVQIAIELARHAIEPGHGLGLQVLVVAEAQRGGHMAAHAAARHFEQACVQALANRQRRIGGLADHRQAGLRRLPAQDVEDLVLVGKVVIDRRLGDAQRAAQVVHRHARIALGVEKLGGGVEDLAPTRFLALGNVRASRAVFAQRGGFGGAWRVTCFSGS
uniref:Uncharacterized protein n=1 Tax=Solanum lycopersicum TaxID=4081 RepID=A0A494G967_SOLLC